MMTAFVEAAQGQTPPSGQARSPAELAKAIAQTIDANTAKQPPGFPIIPQGAVSHDNIVEMKYVIRDRENFSRIKSNVDQMRLSSGSYFCNESRISSLKQGVVFRFVYALADGSDQLDFTVDKSSCDRLARPQLLDPKSLAELAAKIAQAESAEAEKETTAGAPNSPNPIFHVDYIMANQGVVEARRTVLSGSGWGETPAARQNVAGVLAGYLCTKYRDSILQGVVFHEFFARPDGSAMFDVTVDKSNC
jgi:hypothetical protein